MKSNRGILEVSFHVCPVIVSNDKVPIYVIFPSYGLVLVRIEQPHSILLEIDDNVKGKVTQKTY